MTAPRTAANFLPHDAAPEELEQASAIASRLMDVEGLGHVSFLLTDDEIHLLTGLRLRLRARVRQNGFEDEAAYGQATQWILSAAKAISEEPTS